METKIYPFPKNKKSQVPSLKNSTGKSNDKKNITNLTMYKLQKSLRKQGFEIVEDANGKITLVVRVLK